jgi:O-6-methylguanine DNA methyltransferase
VGYWSVTTNDEAIVSVDFHGDACPTERSPKTALERQTASLLERYFNGEKVDFADLPIDYSVPETHLRARVMRRLREIPYGKVYSYQWLAAELGMPQAPRAIGGALGRNTIPIIAPCHRIVAKNGLIGGFMRGQPEGRRVKTFLLELEGHRFSGTRLLREWEDLLPGLA